MTRTLLALSLTLLSWVPGVAVLAQEPTSAPEAMTKAEDIVAIASGNEDFETLVAALTAAELVETLQGEGPFTVFAPTDEAFEALPEGTLEDLLKPENKEKLTAILTYHVVPGNLMAADLKSEDVETVQTAPVTIKVEEGKVTVNEAAVVTPDIAASNGVIHVIDKVLLPPETQN